MTLKNLKRDRNNNLFTPAVFFRNENTNKEVLFVGLNHIGPTHYFERVIEFLKKQSRKSENYSILREFFTCQNNNQTLTSNVLNITADEAISLNSFLKKTYFPEVFFKQTKSDLDLLFNIYKFEFESCSLDVDAFSFRPSHIVNRNKKSCNQAHSSSIECQWHSLEKYLATHPRSKEGDLVLDQQSVPVQIAAINMYRGLPAGGHLELWTRLLVPTNYVLDNTREKNLIKNTMLELSKASVQKVILPWGVGHVQAIKSLLYAEGYRQFDIKDILYAGKSDKGLTVSIDSMLFQDFDFIGEQYNF